MKNSSINEILEYIHSRNVPPRPWIDDVPMNYLDSHLQKFLFDLQTNQHNDHGCRRIQDIRIHSEWLHQKLCKNTPSRILDLDCGPGYFSHYLAGKEHFCLGIDISATAIECANNKKGSLASRLQFKVGNILTIDFPSEFDLVIMPYSIFNDLNPDEATLLIQKIRSSLTQTGQFYFEALVLSSPADPYLNRWQYAPFGNLFCPNPCLCLSEQFYCPITQTIIHRVYNIDLAEIELQEISTTQTFYTSIQYKKLLIENGFHSVYFPKLPKSTYKGDDRAYFSLVARKKDE